MPLPLAGSTSNTMTTMNRSTTSMTSKKESSTDPSPPPLQTVELLQALGSKKDRDRNTFIATGWELDKVFPMPNGKVEEASNIDKLHHNVRHPAKDEHIVPGINHNSLLSIPKFVHANYIVIFDNNEINIYDANKTTIIVSCGGILRGWQCRQTNLWQVPPHQKCQEQQHIHSPLQSMPYRIPTQQTATKQGHPQRVWAQNSTWACTILPRGRWFPH